MPSIAKSFLESILYKHNEAFPASTTPLCMAWDEFPKLYCMVLDLSNAFKSSVADMKVEALSDITSFGRDFQLLNCLKACKNVSYKGYSPSHSICKECIIVIKRVYFSLCILQLVITHTMLR